MMSSTILSLHTVDAMFQAAEEAVRKVLERQGEEERDKGAVLRVYNLPDPMTGFIGLGQLIKPQWVGGEKNRTKQDKYEVVSFEKAIRLADNIQIRLDCVSSWESRDPARNHFGGAITLRCNVEELGPRYSDLIFSVSGLREDADEAVALLIPILVKQWAVIPREVRTIIVRSENNLALGLVEKELGVQLVRMM